MVFGCFVSRAFSGVRSIGLTAGCSLLPLMAPGALAQVAAPQAGDQNDDIVVTAQKRSQNLQDVGITMAAISGDKLRDNAITTSTEIAKIIPGISVSGVAGGQFTTFVIRGVTQSDFGDHTEAPTAVYLDEGYIASGQGQSFALFDLERVEALKGPQGTLFGRNATGGLVHFISRKPTQELDGFVQGTYGSYNQTRLEAAIGGGLGDKVSVRAAGLFNSHKPVLKNLYLRADGRRADGEWTDHTVAGRFHLEFQPTETLKILFTAHAGESRKSTSPYDQRASVPVLDGSGRVIDSIFAAPTETRFAIIPPGAINVDPSLIGIRPVPGGDWGGYRGGDPEALTVTKNFSDRDGNRFRMWGGSAKVSYELGDLNLVSITDYKKVTKRVYMDIDASPRNDLVFPALAETANFSEELRLSRDSGRFRWIVGAYYLNIDTNAETGFLINAPLDATIRELIPNSVYIRDLTSLRTKSYSLFAQAEYDLSDVLTIIAGARGTQENKDFTYRTDQLVRATFASNLRNFADGDNRMLWSGKAQLNWKPVEDVLIYGGINRGVKAGSWNAPLAGNPVITDAQLAYKPEVLTSYEVGLKTTFWDGRGRFNAAAFYYDYHDYQASLFLGLAQRILNADATIKGLEAEFAIKPVPGLDIQISGAFTDTNVEDVNVNGIVRDRESAYAPRWTGNASARYRVPVGFGQVYAQVDASYSGRFYYSLTNFTSTRVNRYVIPNAEIGFTSLDGRFSLAAFARNFTDKRYIAVGADLSGFGGYSEQSYGNPRWLGIRAGYTF
ncbi:TonB-dependent receptor [Rhizorhabdus wittichii RW1]|uniref:TonB-dependent receptor n=1 Tax=Rhizorhabdus wittichii (strain DSM 6014 / CCUG 31198 / JCM 15750 / NBRC 105917 / EY 4224 / RW1) TaxID=392499 RepID=A0A9J9LFJ1_RHIWR|nr:TonB-dependent receptor [Rhizorhabdus wittichii RW1]